MASSARWAVAPCRREPNLIQRGTRPLAAATPADATPVDATSGFMSVRNAIKLSSVKDFHAPPRCRDQAVLLQAREAEKTCDVLTARCAGQRCVGKRSVPR
jgi:hypothetical protein